MLSIAAAATPPAPPTDQLPLESPSPRLFRLWLALILALAVVCLKTGHLLLHPQFWAEDGNVFFSQQFDHRTPYFFVPYVGYLLFIPRTIDWLSNLFPAAFAPAFFTWSAVAVTTLSFASLRKLDVGVPFLVLLAAFVLTPTDNELFGSPVNLQWFSQFYLVVRLALWVQGKPGNQPLHWFAIFATALTGPFSIFILPAGFLAATWVTLTRRKIPPISGDFIVFTLSAVTQFVVLVNYRERTVRPISAILDFISTFQLHTLGRELFAPAVWYGLCGATFLGSLLLVTAAQRPVVILSISALFVQIIPSGLKNGYASFNPQQVDRYFLYPKVIILWSMAICVFALVRRWPRLTPIAWLVTLMPLLFNAWHIRPMLQRPPLEDLNWQRYAAELDAGRATDIPLNPKPWGVHVKPRHRRSNPLPKPVVPTLPATPATLPALVPAD